MVYLCPRWSDVFPQHYHHRCWWPQHFDNCVVRFVNGQGKIYTYVGTIGTCGNSGEGVVGGSALLQNPTGMFLDSAFTLYICDTGNNLVRKVLGPSTYSSDPGFLLWLVPSPPLPVTPLWRLLTLARTCKPTRLSLAAPRVLTGANHKRRDHLLDCRHRKQLHPPGGDRMSMLCLCMWCFVCVGWLVGCVAISHPLALNDAARHDAAISHPPCMTWHRVSLPCMMWSRSPLINDVRCPTYTFVLNCTI